MPLLGPRLAPGGVGPLVALAQGLVAVGALDRTVQPSMRNLDIGDTRNKLGVHSLAGLLGTGGNGLIPLLGCGKAGA